MITLIEGNVLKAETDALVNTVNCVGVMGRGVALQFKKAYPENFKAYKKACDAEEVRPGSMFVFDLNSIYKPRYIINFPTKRHWRAKSRIEDIEEGLKDLLRVVKEREISSIAIPPLGCGLGGLDWSDVRPRIESAFQELPEVEVMLFEPKGAPKAAEMPRSKKLPKMTLGRAALLGLMRRYLAAVMDPTVTLLEVHKLMYFLQEAGEPLKLRYQKGPYGPYASNLRHVLNEIEGHFIRGFADGEEKPEIPLELIPEAADQAEELIDQQEEVVRKRFERVVNTIKGFETTYGMELLASVHWVAIREGATTPEQATQLVHKWTTRKQMFQPRHIEIVWRSLHNGGWLPVESAAL